MSAASCLPMRSQCLLDSLPPLLGVCDVYSVAFPLIPMRQDPPRNLKLHGQSANPTDLPVSVPSQSWSYSCVRPCHALLRECWGFEPSSSCLHIKCSYLLNCLPSPMLDLVCGFWELNTGHLLWLPPIFLLASSPRPPLLPLSWQ